MKASQEKDALDALRNIQRQALRLKEANLLEVLARDDQIYQGRDPDTVHNAVSTICRELERASDSINTAVNVLAHVMDKTPSGRPVTIDDCIRCGQPALPRPKAGLCFGCDSDWRKALLRNPHMDRGRFLRDQGK